MNLCMSRICGRFFAPDRLEKHESICKKASTRKRKPFDPTKMRMTGTEAEPYIRKVSAKISTKAPVKAESSSVSSTFYSNKNLSQIVM